MSLSPKVAAAIAKAREAYLATLKNPIRPGPDWFSVSEYAESEKMSHRPAGQRLRKMNEAGLLERKKDWKMVWWKVKP